MIGSESVQPDPSQIGGVPKAPFALLPNPVRLFTLRASRFDVLAADSALAPYLRFLAHLTRCQADLAATLPAFDAPPREQVARANANGMPPLDRSALADAPTMSDALTQMFEAVAKIDKPPEAERALAQAREADSVERRAMARNILADALPPEGLARHVFIAAAVQVVAAGAAATLTATDVQPVETGVCPACGGPPVTSVVVGFPGAEGVRYATCACCSTQWNEVRVKCLACGSTKGIGYRALETSGGDATVKAEVCDSCGCWMKILYQNVNPSLEAVADDVASLGLDILMRKSDYRRAGFNPFLIGY